MNITDVKVFLVAEEKLKAYVTIVLENCFVVRDLKVIEGNESLFVAMPSRKRKDGTFRDVAHPIDQGTRERMEREILGAYLSEIKKNSEDVESEVGDDELIDVPLSQTAT